MTDNADRPRHLVVVSGQAGWLQRRVTDGRPAHDVIHPLPDRRGAITVTR